MRTFVRTVPAALLLAVAVAAGTVSLGARDDEAPTILSLDVVGITPDSATVTWMLNEKASGKVRYGTSSKYGAATREDDDLQPVHSQTLSGLEPDTTYHFRVVSTDDQGDKVRSSDQTLTTAAAGDADPTAAPQPSPSLESDADPVLVGTGDIARCSGGGDEATAALLDQIPGTIFTTGDNAYNDGTRADFEDCFDPSWGRHRDRIRPAAGNHEYNDRDAEGYFDYFGSAAGEPGKGYYSYDLGSWHIIVLNSNCAEVGGCEADSDQGRWLQAELEANDVECTLAYWHHPLYSSGRHGPDEGVKPFWESLYAAGADVVISGHDHDYERFDLQDPNGMRDRDHGIRQFVVGTGGGALRPFESDAANSQARNRKTVGVLKLTLRDGSYDWEFVPVAGRRYTDAGSSDCVAPA